MARRSDQPPALAEIASGPARVESATWRTHSTSSLQDQLRPAEGAAAHKLRDQEGKNPFFGLLKEERGQERGAIKCFCFIYKERHFREALLKEDGPPLPQLRAAAKLSQGGEREIGGAKGPQTPPSDRSHELSPPTLNASTPGTPLGGGREYVHSGGGTGLGKGGNNLSAAAGGGKGTGQ